MVERACTMYIHVYAYLLNSRGENTMTDNMRIQEVESRTRNQVGASAGQVCEN